jgi:hypothetical protein
MTGSRARKLSPSASPVRHNSYMSKKTKQKIVPFLWFDNRAEEAVKFYTSIFKNSRRTLHRCVEGP